MGDINGTPLGKKRGLSSITPDQTYATATQSKIPSESADNKRRRIREAPSDGQIQNLPPRPKDICEDCAKLDLRGLTQKAIQLGRHGPFGLPSYRWLSVADVGFRYRRPQETNCSLCRILIASRIESREIQWDNHGTWVRGDEIRAMSFFMHHDLGKKRIQTQNPMLCLVVVPKDYRAIPNVNYDTRDHIKSNGCAVIVQDENTSSIFTPKAVSSLVDWDIAKEWLGFCTKHHKLLCHKNNLCILDSNFQVIDCDTLSIGPLGLGAPYVALSYVWGNIQVSNGLISDNYGRKLLPELLSSVIKDSITVTKALGYKFLWVDKFCIDQDNPDTKHRQIQQMGTIYQNSELTLIAAAGTDEHYGLPGVGSNMRSPQLTTKAQGVTVIWTKDTQESIISSHWSSRGWTFQEGLLSRRRLIFTDEQVYFECRTMNCFEGIHCPLEEMHIKSRAKTYEYLRNGIFGRIHNQQFGKLMINKLSIYDTFRQYLSYVQDYSSRDLSYDEDSLKAFQGIIQDFSSRNYSFANIWGLSYPRNSEERETYFVQSLTWAHEENKPRRRENFPSWAWVGWQGKARYGIFEGPYGGFKSRIKSLHFETPDYSRVELRDLNDLSPRILHITAAVVPAELICYRPMEDRDSVPSHKWTIGNCLSYLAFSYNAASDDEVREYFKDTAKWRCIYVGDIYDSVYTSYVLVLKFESAYSAWVRAGIFHTWGPINTMERVGVNADVGSFKIV